MKGKNLKDFFGPSMLLSAALLAIQIVEKVLEDKKQANEQAAMESRLVEMATESVMKKLKEEE
jgi:hypothetical protein